jgi:hypothetical protein
VFGLPAIDKYITCGRDGTFRLWNAGDMKHLKTVNNGSSWIVDCLYLPLSRKMVFTTMDRAISYYDVNRWGLKGFRAATMSTCGRCFGGGGGGGRVAGRKGRGRGMQGRGGEGRGAAVMSSRWVR